MAFKAASKIEYNLGNADVISAEVRFLSPVDLIVNFQFVFCLYLYENYITLT